MDVDVTCICALIIVQQWTYIVRMGRVNPSVSASSLVSCNNAKYADQESDTYIIYEFTHINDALI